MELSAVEIRVLGCLIEKRRTTPETYPLTINSLRLACNQSTNRHPIVDYDEPTVREAAAALGHRRLVRLASGQGSRATKYRHVANEALGVSDAELALLCVLMLRGAQTPGELKARAGRLHEFEGLDEVHATLDRLIERELLVPLGRRPGQKEERYAQLLGGAEEDSPGPGSGASLGAEEDWPAPIPGAAEAGHRPEPAVDASPALTPVSAGGADTGLERRVAELEAQVGELRASLAALRRDLGDPGGE